MRGLGLLFLGISCLMSFLAMPTVARKKCGKFTFPDVTPDMTITRSEHSTMAIPVTFDIFEYPECENDTVYIYVSQEKAETGLPRGNVCIARLTNAACGFNFSQGCSCMDGIDGIVFTKTVTREDSGIWVWMTSPGTWRKEVKVEVTYPPRATELRINAISMSAITSNRIFAAPNTALQVTCKWEKGHPDDIDPSKVQLLNVQGVPLGISDRGDTWIQAEFLVGCEHAGNITCVVLGAQQNGSAELVVQNCPLLVTESAHVPTRIAASLGTTTANPPSVHKEGVIGIVASFAAIVIVVIGVVAFVCVARKRIGQSRASVSGNPNDVTTTSRRQRSSTTRSHNDYDVVGNLTSPDYDVLYRAPTTVDEDGYLIVMATQHDTIDDDYTTVV